MDMLNFKDLNLSNEIQKALKGLGYEKPTDVQEQVIAKILNKNDVAVKSHTGSGKTAAFAIPICEMLSWEINKPQALVLTPTRELAVQVREDISNIGKFKRIKAVALFGKQPFSDQERELKQKTHAAVGTPGRVLDHIERETLPLDQIRYLVIDEADEMLSMGFIDQVEAIIKRLPEDRVTMLFSATLEGEVKDLCQKYMNNPEYIVIKQGEAAPDRIGHYYLEIMEDKKLDLLRDITIVKNPDSCIIFCSTKERVDNVYEGLRKSKHPCFKIHGGMMQQDRLDVMERFKRGEFSYLVATDVAARGIDVEDINIIINYDIPMEKESYVHRIGRTGRAGREGEAITFVTPYEGKFLNNIEDYIGFKLIKLDVPSKGEVEKAKAAFKDKIGQKPVIKKDKSAGLNKEIMKLYFNGGRNKKMRTGDFVGAISSIDGVTFDDIGIIDIQENVSYVDILNGKGRMVLEALRDATIKGKKLKVERAQK